jgi:uncharacterized membrane protein YkoI
MWSATALAVSLLVSPSIAGEPALPAPAQPPHVILAANQGLVPLEQVLGILRKRYSGDQLDARIVRSSPGVVIYEIQWLTQEGRKIVFIVNARDGKIIATRGLEGDANSGR